MKLGALNLPSYRTFSLDELEEATNNFDTTNFMGEIPNGQVWYMNSIILSCYSIEFFGCNTNDQFSGITYVANAKVRTERRTGFKYLGSIIQGNREIDEYVMHLIGVGG